VQGTIVACCHVMAGREHVLTFTEFSDQIKGCLIMSRVL